MTDGFKKGDLVYKQIPHEFKNGKWSYRKIGPLRVMGTIDGYLMVRSKNAMPSVLSKKDAIIEGTP